MASPKIFLFKTKIASNDYWLFLLIEFMYSCLDNFLRHIHGKLFVFLPTLLSLCKLGN